MPPVSVVMPVHRVDEFIETAVKSVLADLSPEDELLIVLNGSALASFPQLAVAKSLGSNVRLLASEQAGIVPALNLGVTSAKHEFIARMDGDDVSLPGRFRIQAKFLASNPDIAVVGGQAYLICPHGKRVGLTHLPIRIRRSKFKPLLPKVVHPAVMFRKSLVLALGGYSNEYPHAEDHNLWNRVLSGRDIANLIEPVLEYRIHPGQVSVEHQSNQVAQALIATLDALAQNGVSSRWARVYCRYWEFLRILTWENNRTRIKALVKHPLFAIWFTITHARPIIGNLFYKKEFCQECLQENSTRQSPNTTTSEI